MRYAGIRDNKILLISKMPFSHPSMEIIEVPSYLDHIPSSDIMAVCRVKNGKIVSKFSKKPAKELKIAFVGNWKMNCGIATYSESLWPEVIKYIGDYKLFIEDNPNITGTLNEIGGLLVSEDKIIKCWNRGESVKKLVAAIHDYEPDIVWIQHEFGLWAHAGRWLSLMNQLSQYRVIVTMHSVFHHRDKTIVEAAMPEIVVHLDGAKKVLKNEKHIPGNVYVIPHGCSSCLSQEKLWNFYKSEHTFLQFGFGFRYKGWENSIQAAAILAKKYPDTFFTGLFSESPHNKLEHEIYYNELMDLIKRLNLEEHVALIRGFQSDETLDSYLRTNQASLFPYISHPAHEVFGASGAARLAMSKGLPVVTSSVNHFSDLPSIKADSPEEIANSLDQLFSNPHIKNLQIKKQLDYLNENTWENIALQHINLFENEINDKK